MNNIVICGLSGSTNFFILFHKWYNLKKKKSLNTEWVFWYTLQLLSEICINIRRTEWDIIINVNQPPHGLVVRGMRSWVWFPAPLWEFFLKGRIPAVTVVWVGWYNLGLRALMALHPPISPLTSSEQRNCVSWGSQTQKSVTLLPRPGGRTTKSTMWWHWTPPKKIIVPFLLTIKDRCNSLVY
jgi:hypothetical protein